MSNNVGSMGGDGLMTEKRITKQLLKNESGEFDIESIHTLDLQNRGISELGCIGECVGLEVLKLSGNNIQNVDLLSGLVNLVFLDLSANNIKTINGLRALENLSTLNLAGNVIDSVDSLTRNLSCLPRLFELRLQDEQLGLRNPVCSCSSYRADIKASLPQLFLLDGEKLNGEGSNIGQICADIDNNIQECERLWSKSSNIAADDEKFKGVQMQLKMQHSSDLASTAEQHFDDTMASCRKLLLRADDFLEINR